jgi:hypothetical protein
MKQEEKQLLLKDLCARLPYGVKCRMLKSDSQVCTLDSSLLDKVEILEPYLRPMSSMTEEEFTQYKETLDWRYVDDDHYEYFDTLETFDWLNAHHFDYRGLIDKKLALEAPEGMYE